MEHFYSLLPVRVTMVTVDKDTSDGASDVEHTTSPLEHLAKPSTTLGFDPDDGLPPYRPDIDDHVSLSMVDSSTVDDVNPPSSESLSRLPRVYRTRSAKSDKSGSSAPAGPQGTSNEDDLYVDGQKLTRRKSTPAHSLRRRRQHSSEALKYNSPAYSDSDGSRMRGSGDEVYYASPELGYSHAEKHREVAEDDKQSTGTSEPEIASEDTIGPDSTTFEDFDCSTQLTAESTHELQIPLSIRLRRASEQYRSQFLSLLHSKTVHDPKSDTSSVTSSLAPSFVHKSSVAGAAVTHTNINPFKSEPARGSIELKEGRIKLNSTLQIIQSRDSVYEIIWEDNPSSVVPQHGEEQTDDAAQRQTTASQSPVKTKLAAWAWSSPFSSESQGEIVFVLPTASISSNRVAGQIESTEQCVVGAEVPSATQRQDDLILPFHRRRGSTSADRPSSQERQQRLGNRKLSNLDPEDEQFCTHRDSLLLAHRSIFRDEGGDMSNVNPQTKELIDPHILQIRQASWTHPEQSSSVRQDIDGVASFMGQLSAPEYSPHDITVGSSNATAARESKRDEGKRRIYILTQESELEDEADRTQCLQ